MFPLRKLYVDFNSYFASVEQQERPALRGKPIGVLPVATEGTCCIAASYEAKRFGIKTGTSVRDARERCPEIRFVLARPALYVEYHQRLVEVVESCTPVEQVCSIDEMVCDLSGSQQRRERALMLAQQIKQRITAQVGTQLRCSVGIAPNRFLAKTASDMQKPDGCVVIEHADLPHCLHRLELRDLCGIGAAMERRLHEMGIYTVAQLCAADAPLLRRAWGGVAGDVMHAHLRGELMRAAASTRSSFTHSHVLPPELRNEESAYAVIQRLLQKAATRMRHEGLACGSVQIWVQSWVQSRQGRARANWGDERRLAPTQATRDLLALCAEMWQQRAAWRGAPMSVGVVLGLLVDARQTTDDLFAASTTGRRLDTAVDAINQRFGRQTLFYGGAFHVRDAAPMRIAFSHIPDLLTESDD